MLEARMAAARAEGDDETADLLADAIARLRSGESPLTEQRPGRMGLGTSQDATPPGARRCRKSRTP